MPEDGNYLQQIALAKYWIKKKKKSHQNKVKSYLESDK